MMIHDTFYYSTIVIICFCSSNNTLNDFALSHKKRSYYIYSFSVVITAPLLHLGTKVNRLTLTFITSIIAAIAQALP